jgi:hypothetical protein
VTDPVLLLTQIQSTSHRTHRSLAIVPIAAGSDPYDLSLPDGGDAFWLDARTIAHVVETGEDGDKKQELFAISVTLIGNAISVGESVPVGSFPVTTAADFLYAHSAGVLVFSAYVHADGDLKAVKDNDDKYDNRGNSALVYDKNFERHWDTWVGPKHKSLFTVRLYKDQGKVVLGKDFINVLQGTALVRGRYTIKGSHHPPICDLRVLPSNLLVEQMISISQAVRSSSLQRTLSSHKQITRNRMYDRFHVSSHFVDSAIDIPRWL